MKSSLRLATVLLVLAALSGGWRLRHTTVVIPGDSFQFSYLNDMRWDAAGHQMTRTGGDPYVWIVLPETAVPLDGVTFEFAGSQVEHEGTYYVFQAPAHLQEVTLGPALPGKIEPSAGGFTVSARFEPSKALRLDLPDFLSQPVTLRRMVIHTPFIRSTWSFHLAVLCALAGLIALVWPVIRIGVARWTRLELGVFVGLAVLKIVLASDVPVTLQANAQHDDALFVSQAASMMDGQWLGPFGQITLAKGPTYPLFLAGVGALGVRLQLAQAALHALACATFVLALRPLLASVGGRLLLFAVLLFDPHTLSASAVGQVLRTGIQPALTLFTLAGFIGLALRASLPWRRAATWALLAGVAGSAFWYSREEGLWLVPSVILLLGLAAIEIRRTRAVPLWPRFAVLALPAVILFAVTWGLRLTNARHYGAAITVDQKEGAFPAAYGALTRIVPTTAIPGVPVTRETRLRAYAVSPAFAELKPMLEGAIGTNWSKLGWEGITPTFENQEIRGGWFQWALRQSAEAAGHYRDAAAANRYWQRVADEINAACDRGVLPAGRPRTGFVPRWDASLAAPLRSALYEAVRVTTQFSDFRLMGTVNTGSEARLAVFRRVTHERGVDQATRLTALSGIRAVVAQLYQGPSAAATSLALLATLMLGAFWLRNRTLAGPLAVLTALIGGAAALMIIVALVDATSFRATHAIYLAPATPLVLAAWVLAPAWAARAWRGRGAR